MSHLTARHGTQRSEVEVLLLTPRSANRTNGLFHRSRIGVETAYPKETD